MMPMGKPAGGGLGSSIRRSAQIPVRHEAEGSRSVVFLRGARQFFSGWWVVLTAFVSLGVVKATAVARRPASRHRIGGPHTGLERWFHPLDKSFNPKEVHLAQGAC